MRKLKQTSQTWLVALAALGLSATLAQASTFVSGAVSGTWTKTGSPYIATGNLSVSSGQTLTIQPGVTVIIGQGLNMDVEGTISAVGTAAERITIRGANSSLYWDKIYINYTGGSQSSFVNCNISEATNALYMSITTSVTLAAQVTDCYFTNCVANCVFASAESNSNHYGGGTTPVINGMIANCAFIASSNGININVSGYFNLGQGSASPTVANNVFSAISGTAISFTSTAVGIPGITSSPQYVNNVFYQSGTAISRAGDLRILNNDFAGYNCFYSNATNFDGYPPGVYGTICCQNARGTNCDVAYNIFVNPLFAETVKYTLATNSPCIDAGDPDSTYLDTKFPPSQGSTVNDMGLYGGPYAGNWLTNAYNGTTNFLLTAQQYVGVTINPSAAGLYRLDSTSDVANGPWTQVTNVALLSTPWTWIDYSSPTNGQRFFRAVLLP